MNQTEPKPKGKAGKGVDKGGRRRRVQDQEESNVRRTGGSNHIVVHGTVRDSTQYSSRVVIDPSVRRARLG